MKNNENTQRKLIDAVDQIIKNEGLHALTIANLSTFTGVHKNLIFSCFGSMEGLLEVYIDKRDFWTNSPEPVTFDVPMDEQVRRILTEEVSSFYNHCEMKAMLLNEILKGNSLVANLIKEESPVDNSAYYDIVSTLLQAGTDHLILSSYGLNNCIYTADKSNVEKDLMQSIGQIIDWTFG